MSKLHLALGYSVGHYRSTGFHVDSFVQRRSPGLSLTRSALGNSVTQSTQQEVPGLIPWYGCPGLCLCGLPSGILNRYIPTLYYIVELHNSIKSKSIKMICVDICLMFIHNQLWFVILNHLYAAVTRIDSGVIPFCGMPWSILSSTWLSKEPSGTKVKLLTWMWQ